MGMDILTVAISHSVIQEVKMALRAQKPSALSEYCKCTHNPTVFVSTCANMMHL